MITEVSRSAVHRQVSKTKVRTIDPVTCQEASGNAASNAAKGSRGPVKYHGQQTPGLRKEPKREPAQERHSTARYDQQGYGTHGTLHD